MAMEIVGSKRKCYPNLISLAKVLLKPNWVFVSYFHEEALISTINTAEDFWWLVVADKRPQLVSGQQQVSGHKSDISSRLGDKELYFFIIHPML